MSDPEPKWLSVELVIQAQEQLALRSGSQVGVKDMNLLQSAMARAENSFFYEQNDNLYDLAARYTEGLAKNHAFHDANKRTSFLAADLFLKENGLRLDPKHQEAYLDAITGIVKGTHSHEDLTELYRTSAIPYDPRFPDAGIEKKTPTDADAPKAGVADNVPATQSDDLILRPSGSDIITHNDEMAHVVTNATDAKVMTVAPEVVTEQIRGTILNNTSVGISMQAVQTDNAGSLIIEAKDPSATKYAIQMSPDGKTASVLSVAADGEQAIVHLDEAGTKILNDALKSEELGEVLTLDNAMPRQASSIAEMKSTLITSLGENADGLQIDIESNGRMTILPNAEDANKYNIQIAPDGKSAELAIQRPGGMVDVVQVDEKGLAAINDALGGADEALKLRDPGSRFPTLDDIRPQFVERLPINPELGHLPGERVLLQFDPKAVGNTVDVAKTAASADNVADVVRAVNAATDALKVGKVAGKTAKLSIVGGVALTGGVAALLHYAHSSQRGLAETLNKNDQLSDEALEEYLTLNKDIETEMQAENLAGQGWLFLITTPAVEASARAKFDEFSAKHNLSAETHDALAMSLFKGESLSAQFASEALDMMPDSMSEVDPELQHLWRLTKDLEEAESDRRVAHQPPVAYGGGMYGGYHPYDPNREERKTQTDEALKEAKFEHQAEFARLLVDPDTGSKVLSMMPQDVLIDMVEESAQYHSDGQDPLIQKIGELQRQINSDETGFFDEWGLKGQRDDALEELEGKPEVLHAYIRSVFGDETASRNPSSALQSWNNADPDATIATMPDYMQMRAMDVAAESVRNLENKDNVHPYLEELSVLQKRVDNDHIGSSWRESNNERIQEIKSELLQNPRVLAEYAQQSPEVQSVLDEYNANKADYDRYSDVTPAEVKQTFEVMREAAVENEGDIGVSQQHPMLKELGDLYYERSQKSFYEWIDKPDLDARIEQRELELQQRPDILSDYMQQKTGDDLISQTTPASTNDPLMRNFNGQSGFDYAITPTSLPGLPLPNDLGVSDVQGSENYTPVGDYTLHPQSLELETHGVESELMMSPADKILNSTVLNTDNINHQIEEIRAIEYTVPDIRLSPQVYPLIMEPEELGANFEDQVPDQSSESDYVAVAITMQRLQSGEPIDAVEQQELEAILKNPDANPELIAMIEENYPSETSVLASSQDFVAEEVIPQVSHFRI